ncbi:phage protein Gp36 family protein [Maridesulfovibrio sp.]|uniref:phage protein Gp36 family protein n=1 Tax=Maridesulfovibrio sp. TaxID=2795000 RepID=UPI002AA5F11A|nr:phage protein Gp36 family protein [Maridesulfovibrio sp.]
MNYCTRTDLTDYILADYLAAADNQQEDTVDKAITNVSAEMTEALVAGGYTVTADAIPAAVKRICSTIAAYRSIGAITSLITSEAGSENEFLPLQRLAERADKEMALIRKGDFPLAPPEAKTAQPNDTAVVVTPPSKFGDCWSKF